MKNRNSKRSFDQFTKREKSKKRRAKEALALALEGLGVRTEDAKIIDREDRLYRRVKNGGSAVGTIARGLFSSSKSGYGFVNVIGADRDIFIPKGKTMGAIDGDTVEILYRTFMSRYGEEKTEGRITKIIAFGITEFAGTLVKNDTADKRERLRFPYLVIPDNRRLSFDLPVANAEGARIGDKVLVKLKRKEFRCEGEILASFGDAETKSANYDAILAEEGIPCEFSEAALAEAELSAKENVDDGGRRDLTEQTIFTIDGASAKDLDDAISLTKCRDGRYKLGVHIADVSTYVKEKSALDRETMARGTSVYFTDKVVPMLPKCLSNGACSLNPDEKKRALSVTVTVSAEGDILDTKIEKTLIRSCVRGVYSEINDIFSKGKQSEFFEKYQKIMPTLRKMHELYGILLQRSYARGAIELDTAEGVILLDADDNPVNIVRAVRGDAERLIEQFMLLANEAVATELSRLGVPCIYRVHENPPPDKLREFLLFMQNLGFQTTEISPESPSGEKLNQLIRKATDSGLGESCSYVLLRSMAKAKYSDKQASHFGLGIEHYCHFTSPIRRLSDLATHRMIHKVLFEKEPAKKYTSYAYRAAAAATEAELRALSAERRIENLYKVIYMQQFIGKIFEATVSSVTSFGVFASLPNTCEGLLPIAELPGVYTFDEKTLTLRSRSRSYQIGDRIQVILEETDMIHGKLRFSDARDRLFDTEMDI